MKKGDFSLDLIQEKYLKQKFEKRLQEVFTYGWLTDKIGYFHFRRFGSLEQSRKVIDEIVDTFEEADGIIVDVRNNDGGSDRVGKLIADRFADRKRLYMTTQIRNGPKHDDFTAKKYWFTEPDGPRQFLKPVILLTHRFSVSAAENFALAMRVMPHVTMVGDATSGVFADVYSDQLPNGWKIRVSYKLFLDQNGFCWEGIGVPADIRQTNRKEEISDGRDKVLELATKLLQEGRLKPQKEEDSLARGYESLVDVLSKTVASDGIPAGLEAYRKTKAGAGDGAYVEETELYGLANAYATQNQLKEAQAVYRLGIEEFPQSYIFCLGLADVLDQLGNSTDPRHFLQQAAKRNRRSYPWEKDSFTAIEKALEGVRILSKDIERAVRQNRFAKVVNRYRQEPDGYYVAERAMNRLGYRLVLQEKVEEAIQVFQINTQVFPDSFNTWDSLGEAHLVRGDYTRAIEYYEKSLTLNPQNDNAKTMIERMKKNDD